MTHTRAEGSLGSKVRVKTGGQTEAIALPDSLMWSVTADRDTNCDQFSSVNQQQGGALSNECLAGQHVTVQ